uniref:Uncharacterized protein n=1 Tax=Trichobilharzia regenti TaxID=157069 RepID=A0AA85JGI2_TRIRE
TSKHANDASSETSVESSSTNGSEMKTSPDSPNSTEGLQATENTRTSSDGVFDKERQIGILLSRIFRCRNHDSRDIYKVTQSTPKSPAATRRLPTPQPHAPRKPPLPPICFRVPRPPFSQPPSPSFLPPLFTGFKDSAPPLP